MPLERKLLPGLHGDALHAEALPRIDVLVAPPGAVHAAVRAVLAAAARARPQRAPHAPQRAPPLGALRGHRFGGALPREAHHRGARAEAFAPMASPPRLSLIHI